MSSQNHRRKMARVRFGRRIRALRQSKGISVEELAGRVGYEEPASLRNVELGNKSPSRDVVIELCWEFYDLISREERNLWLSLFEYEPMGPKRSKWK
jgi:ribosome-binding protein aMBF1 (putative translation factor)